MATRLNAGDERLTSRSLVTKYPWDEWTDGSVWEITRGVDFDCDAETMRGQIKVRQRKDGTNARTSVHRGVDGQPDRVVFQFDKKPAGKRSR
jgi:hypothetical protein